MNRNIITRTAVLQDNLGIFELLVEMGYSCKQESVYRKIISILENGSDILIVAIDNGAIVGYAQGTPYEPLYDGSLLQTISFYVKEAVSNYDDVKEKLFASYEAQAKRFGFKGIVVDVNIAYESDNTYFLSKGFKERGVNQQYIKYLEDI